VGLAFGAFLGGDRLGDGLPIHHQLTLHFLQNTGDLLFWIFTILHPVGEIGPCHQP
jgi:hypothetical protein